MSYELIESHKSIDDEELKNIILEKEDMLNKILNQSPKVHENFSQLNSTTKNLEHENSRLINLNNMMKTQIKLERLSSKLCCLENVKLKTENEHLLSINKKIIDTNRCNVCYTNPKNRIIIPCGHYTSCNDCLSKLTDCPICRNHIIGKLNVYNS